MEELIQIKEKLAELTVLVMRSRNESLAALKDIMNVRDVILYTGLSKSTLYKLTSKGSIKCYKPCGKLIFFKRHEIDAWIFSKQIKSAQEIAALTEHNLIKMKKISE